MGRRVMRLPILLSVPHAGLRVPAEAEPYCCLARDEIIADGDEGAARRARDRRQFGEDSLRPLDQVALVYRQYRDLATGARRQFGTAAGLDGAGPGVGHGVLDGARGDRVHLHFYGVRAAQPPAQEGKQKCQKPCVK